MTSASAPVPRPAGPASSTSARRASASSSTCPAADCPGRRALGRGPRRAPLRRLEALRLAQRPQPIGFSVDGPVDVAVLPEQSASWLGTPGLAGNRGGAAFSTAFRTTRAERDGDRVRLGARDTAAGLSLHLTIELAALRPAAPARHRHQRRRDAVHRGRRQPHAAGAAPGHGAPERQRIQRWTNALVPLELMGTHVGAGEAHTTGRRHSPGFRAGTALFGHFGIEWDLSAASPGGRERLAVWVVLYKELRGLLHTGTAVHADHPDPAYQLHGVVAEDGSDALFALVAMATSPLYPPGPGRLPGLGAGAVCHARPQPPGDVPDGNAHRRGVPLPWWTPAGVRLPGRVLADAGLQAPVLFPERLVLLRAPGSDGA